MKHWWDYVADEHGMCYNNAILGFQKYAISTGSNFYKSSFDVPIENEYLESFKKAASSLGYASNLFLNVESGEISHKDYDEVTFFNTHTFIEVCNRSDYKTGKLLNHTVQIISMNNKAAKLLYEKYNKSTTMLKALL